MHELGVGDAARGGERVLDQRGSRLTRRPGRFVGHVIVGERGVLRVVVVLEPVVTDLEVRGRRRSGRGGGARGQRDQS